MKKLYHLTEHLRPGGGPPGYLYNLYQFAEKAPDAPFQVEAVRISNERSVGVQDRYSLPRFLNRNLRPLKAIVSLLGWVPTELEIHLDRSDRVLCVHLAPLAARLMKCRKSAQPIFLMPHAPVSYSDELMNECDARYGKGWFSKMYRRMLNHIEWRLFHRVDGVVVACKEGLEDYFNGKHLNTRIFEVLSGVPEFSDSYDRNSVRVSLGIDKNKTVVGFFGRFNRDKGFDLFVKAARILQYRNDILFVCAGAGSIDVPDQENLINFGWRSDIDRMISACDTVAIPNRHTYFDLLPLEVLSLGRPVLASRRGGSRKLAELSLAVKLFDNDVDGLVRGVLEFAGMAGHEKIALNRIATDSFLANFNISKFYMNHIVLANEILRDCP